MMRRGGQQQQQQSKALNELCSLILTIIGSPPHSFIPIPFTYNNSNNNNNNNNSVNSCSSRTALFSSKQLSPGGFACLLLGVSLTLMLCGSLTFVIGFILMPWVLGFLFLFYFLGVLSSLSGLGRAILYPPSPKGISAWNYS